MKENLLKNKTIMISALIGLLFLLTLNFLKTNPIFIASENQEYNLAQVSYVPLTSSDVFTEAQTSDFGSFLQALYDWGITIVIVMAILFILIGGIQYMTTDAVFNKKEGISKVQSAIAGLLIALASWLILNIINPDLVQINIGQALRNRVGSSRTTPATPSTGGGTGTITSGGGTTPSSGGSATVPAAGGGNAAISPGTESPQTPAGPSPGTQTIEGTNGEQLVVYETQLTDVVISRVPQDTSSNNTNIQATWQNPSETPRPIGF